MQEEGCWQHRGGTKLQDQTNPLIMKENLETQAMKWWRDMNITWRQNMEQRNSFMCWSSNSGRTWSCTDSPMSYSRNKNSSGRKMHSWMKLRQYELRIYPSSWHRTNMVTNVVNFMQGIQQHACRWAYACNPTHSTHSPRWRQEASPTRVEHVLWQVDAHDHQHTLEDQHEHYASVCCRFNHTQEDHLHVSGRVGWRG